MANNSQITACLCELIRLTEQVAGNTADYPSSLIHSRPVCIQVEGQTELVQGFAIVEVTEQNTTFLRFEDVNGNEIAGTMVTCDCPCTDDDDPDIYGVAFRNDVMTLRQLDVNRAWPLYFNGSIEYGGTSSPINVIVPRDPAWTDMSQVYQSLVDALDAVPGVEAQLVDVSSYNPDNGRDVCVRMPIGYRLTLDRSSTVGNHISTHTRYIIIVDTYTVTISARTITNQTIPSPVFWTCDGRELNNESIIDLDDL